MTQNPTHQPASAAVADDAAAAGKDVTPIDTAPSETEHPATRDAQARQTNAHRAIYAAQALHRHAQVSHSHADGMQQALIELLTDLHHLCDTCDLAAHHPPRSRGPPPHPRNPALLSRPKDDLTASREPHAGPLRSRLPRLSATRGAQHP